LLQGHSPDEVAFFLPEVNLHYINLIRTLFYCFTHPCLHDKGSLFGYQLRGSWPQFLGAYLLVMLFTFSIELLVGNCTKHFGFVLDNQSRCPIEQ